MAKTRRKKELRKLNGKLKRVIDPTLAQALSHPLRGHVLATLGDRIASPNEIAKELGINARDLNYHVKVLARMGMIRLVRTEKRRGVREHFYELTLPLVYFDELAWKQMPEPIQSSFSASLLQVVMEEAVAALRAGTFNARSSHQSRTPMILDEQGCGKLANLMNDTLEKVLEIRDKCAEDLKKTGRDGIPIEVFMMGFETAAGMMQAAGGAAAADA